MHLGVVDIEKGAFGLSSTTVGQLTWYTDKKDLALNNPQSLIRHKTQPTQPSF